MQNTLSKVLIFAAGATIGSVVTWKLLDAKYAQRAEREIEEIKEYYRDKYSDRSGTIETPAPIDEKAEFDDQVKEEYKNLVQNYTGEKGGSESMEIGTPPYVISPDEFDTLDDYDAISLTYYTDGVLADDADHPIHDIANTVGEDFESHFGEYEQDSVFIRNEMMKVDYEILMDYRPYRDVVGPIPKDDE